MDFEVKLRKSNVLAPKHGALYHFGFNHLADVRGPYYTPHAVMIPDKARRINVSLQNNFTQPRDQVH